MSTGQESGKAAGRSRRRSRKLAIRLAVVAGVLVVLAVVARLLVPAGAVRDLVAARLTESLGRPVSVGEASVGLFPRPGVVLRDLTVAEGPDGIAADVEALRLRLSWGPLLRRQIQIDRAEIVRPRVAVRLADPAAAPADDAAAAPPGPVPAEGSAAALRIEHLAIRDGSVTVTRADGAPVADLRGLAEDLALLATPAGDVVVVGTTTVDTLRLHLPTGTLGEGLHLSWRKDLRWEAAAGLLKVITSELALGDLPVAITGEVRGLASGAPVADLRLDGGPAQLASLQGYLPTGLVPQLADLESAGTATLQATVAGPLAKDADSLRWHLRFTLTDGLIEHPALGTPLRDIAVALVAVPGRLDLQNLTARTGRSSLAITGAVTDPLVDPAYDLVVDADVDLGEAMALQAPRPDAPTVSGRASAQLGVTGRAADAASLRLVGPLALDGVAVSGPAMGLAVADLQARGRIDGTRLALQELSLRQGRSDYRISGTVDHPLALLPEPWPGAPATATVDLAVTSTLLDVDEILAAGQAAEAAARATDAAAGAPAAAAAPPAALDYLAKLVGSANVRIGTLVVRQNSLTDVRGTARLDRGRITLNETSAAVYGGTGRLSGIVDLSDPRAGRLDLQLAINDARAEQYFAATTVPGRFTRLANAINGGMDATVSLQGALDDTLGLDLKTLTSIGEVALRDARLAGLPLQEQLVSLLDAPQLNTMTFKDLLQPFRIENGRLIVENLEVQAGPIGIRASGWQNLAGELSAHLNLTLPPEYAQGLRRQLPAQMADLLLDAQGTALELPVAVSGTADAPSVRLDTDGLATLARSRAEAKLSRETDKLKQQAIEEASRHLQDLLKAPADSAAAGADSTGPQTLEDVGKSLLDRLKKKGGGG